MTAAAPAAGGAQVTARPQVARRVKRNGWVIGLYMLTLALFLVTFAIKPGYGPSDLQSLAITVLPIVFAAAAQTVAVISGGIDLSVGSIMALSSVTAAALMAQSGEGLAVGVVILVLVVGTLAGAINGFLIVATRVPDIVVTLAMSFVWAGAALLVLDSPGGAAASWFVALADGTVLIEWLPRAFVLMLVVIAVIWIPIRRSRFGLSLYAVGSDRTAALRSGVNVNRTRLLAYAVTGLFCAVGGLTLTMTTGIGLPVPGPYTLGGVAAIVLGGVSLAGGRGGMLGPIAAAFILALIRLDLVFLGVGSDYSQVIQGVILVVVVMIGGLVEMRRSRQ
ncbi:MAG: ABC transporter permease [Chloroflexota bacterium]